MKFQSTLNSREGDKDTKDKYEKEGKETEDKEDIDSKIELEKREKELRKEKLEYERKKEEKEYKEEEKLNADALIQPFEQRAEPGYDGNGAVRQARPFIKSDNRVDHNAQLFAPQSTDGEDLEELVTDHVSFLESGDEDAT